MKLEYKDLLKIQEEMEQQEEYYNDDLGFYYSLLHEDAGDRD